MDIQVEQNETKGRYYTQSEDGGHVSELTFSIASERMIIADHTDVPDALKGQGIGKALFLQMVEDARQSGIKIVPLCPFVKSQFGKFLETRDVL